MIAIPDMFSAPFGRDDAEPLRAVLVVRASPAIEAVRPIPGEPSVIGERAIEQQETFAKRLAAHGVKTFTLEADVGAPLGALCADGAVLFPEGAFLMRPSDLAARGRASAALEAALAQAQIPIAGRIAAPGLLDGGDVLFAGDTLYIGVPHARPESIGIAPARHGNGPGREQLAAYARERGLKVVEVAIASEVSRLRSVASLIAPDLLLFAPGLVDGAAFTGLRRLEVPPGEHYGAGVLALGQRGVIANVRFRQTIPLLRAAKFAVDAIDLWEFGKIGATPASLALVLKRG
jgi:dimethylargininase